LMCAPSFSRCPSALVWLMRSEPARSTRVCKRHSLQGVEPDAIFPKTQALCI
jgi:hypothetical protein